MTMLVKKGAYLTATQELATQLKLQEVVVIILAYFKTQLVKNLNEWRVYLLLPLAVTY